MLSQRARMGCALGMRLDETLRFAGDEIGEVHGL
jgi:hypothetical protein